MKFADFGNEKRGVIDEWQLAPDIWDIVRHEVDASGRQRGLWILTGSSTPAKDKVHHSGAGRFGRVRMLPMTLQESGDSTGEVSLTDLFDGKLSHASCSIDVQALLRLCCRGGWPQAIDLPISRARRIARDYIDAALTQSVPAKGGRSEVASRLLGSLARNLGQATTYKVMMRDMYGTDEEGAVDARTVSNYVALLESLYLILSIDGWEPPARSPKRFQTKPKRYLVDPSLAVAALRMSEQSLMKDWQTLGLVFENWCLKTSACVTCWYTHARFPTPRQTPCTTTMMTTGLEVNAIVEDAGGRWGAFEIKLSENKADEAAKSLLRMRDKIGRNAVARTSAPQFLAVLVGLGQHAYRREDGVYVIPVGCLGR